MVAMLRSRPTAANLPVGFRRFFWDHDFDALDWTKNRDLIVARLLAEGDWSAICWLRNSLSDEGLREWLIQHHGGGLSVRQLRFWQLFLSLPAEEVEVWINGPAARPSRRRRTG